MLSSQYALGVLKQNPLTDVTECSRINGGSLLKGLAVTLNDVFAKLFQLVKIFITTEYSAGLYFTALKKWDIENNFKDFEMIYYQLRTILDSTAEFLVSQSKDYFNYLRNIQVALFAYSLISASVIFLFALQKYFSNMAKDIFTATFFLSIFPLESLIENPYVMSYLNKERNRLKKGQQ